MAVRTGNKQAADHLIRLACARNTSIEVHHETRQGERISCRTRLLEINGDRIIVEAFRAKDMNRIPLRTDVSMYMLLGGMRYRFESSILQTGLLSKLNDTKRVRAMSIRKPKLIKENQRRSDYRISVAGCDPIVAEMAEVHKKTPSACPIDAERILVRLVNVSGGGIGGLVDYKHETKTKPGTLFHMKLVLPDTDHESLMLCEVRHTRRIEVSEMIRLGIAFLPWEGIDLKAEKMQITQFIATHERNQLRRRK